MDVGGTLSPERLTARLSDQQCMDQLAHLLPTIEPSRTLAALRAALREDDNSLEQNTHAVLGRAIQRLGCMQRAGGH